MNILFTSLYANGLHGSVVHILEYAEYLARQGHNVTWVAVFVSPPMKQDAAARGIRLCSLANFKPDLQTVYDIVWAFHIFIFPALMAKGLNYERFIASSLSCITNLEQFPPFFRDAALLTAISEEVKAFNVRRYGIPAADITVIPNHIPAAFSRKKKECSPKISKVCVISNHVPPELQELYGTGPLNFDFYGATFKNIVRITPEILDRYDVVISIGKTVQYALGMGIPVFEYDRFGGPGYLTLEAFHVESATNFSGRGCPVKRTSEEIVTELVTGYADACARRDALRKLALREFSLSRLLRLQLKAALKATPRQVEDSTQGRLFIAASVAAMELLNEVNAFSNRNRILQTRLTFYKHLLQKGAKNACSNKKCCRA